MINLVFGWNQGMDLVSADFWGFGVKFLRGILDFSVRNSRICAVHAGGIEIKM